MSEPDYLTATRVAYDTVAADYAELVGGELAANPVDQGLLGVFAELVLAGGGPVAELGCGPGRVTAHLHGLGLDARGIDLSPAMVAEARRRYRSLRFDIGSMTALPLADGGLGGVVAWYSIIHTPPESLPVLFAEFHRVLAPGGQVLLAFQVGDEHVHRTEAYGHPVSLDSYRFRLAPVIELLGHAGLGVHVQVLREPSGSYEKTQQGYLMARKMEP